MIEIFPNQANIGATIILNPDGPQNLEDFIYIDKPITASINATIPLSFISENITLNKTTQLEFDNNREIEEIFITIENGFPIDAVIDIISLDNYNNIIDTILKNSNIISANTDNNNYVISSNTNTIKISNSDFFDIDQIKIIASFSTSSITEYVDIYSYYNVKVNLSARFKQRIGE